MILRTTKKILDLNKLKPERQLTSELNNLNQWYVTLCSSTFKGKPFMLFVHVPSYLAVLTEGKSLTKNIPAFRKRLEQLLLRSRFPTKLIDDLLTETHQYKVYPTNSRKVMGHLSQFVQDVEAYCSLQTSYADIDLDRIENNLFDRPYRPEKSSLITPESWWNNYVQGEDPYNDAVKNPPPQSIIKKSILNKDGLTREEELHMENQMLKMDLEQKMGKSLNLNVMNNELPDIPPAIENLFLKQVSLFENQMRTAKEINVYDYIGRPKIKPLAQLKTEHALTREIERIQHLLQKHNVVVDFLAAYPADVVYAFLVDELMLKSVPDVHVPGFISHFIYEEFHPNHELAVMVKVKLFMNDIFNPETDEETLSKLVGEEQRIVLNGQSITTEEFEQALSTYHLTSNSDLILGFDTLDLAIDEKKGIALVSGEIVAKNPIKGKRKIKTPFTLRLTLHDSNNWNVTHFNFDPVTV